MTEMFKIGQRVRVRLTEDCRHGIEDARGWTINGMTGRVVERLRWGNGGHPFGVRLERYPALTCYLAAEELELLNA